VSNRSSYNKPSSSGSRLNRYNILDNLDQVRESRVGNLREDRLERVLTDTNLNTPPSNSNADTSSTSTNPSSPTGSDGSGETIRPTQWTPSWDNNIDQSNNWDSNK